MNREALTAEAHSLTRAQFIARHPHRFLVLRGVGTRDNLPFATAVLHRRDARAAAASQLELIEVVKRPGNPYPDRISIGRARNCDVVLRHESVSKLHAHLLTPAGGRMSLVDLDSQNGTRLDGEALQPHREYPVVPDDVLQFGAVAAELLDAGGLYDLLR